MHLVMVGFYCLGNVTAFDIIEPNSLIIIQLVSEIFPRKLFYIKRVIGGILSGIFQSVFFM